MGYRPTPIDTSEIELDESLERRLAELARHLHDVWAARRLAEGWRHGTDRNQDQKTHPNLIEFSELPDSEKEYDLQSASETLKAVLALGFEINPGQGNRLPAAGAEPQDITEILSDPRRATSANLRSVWLHRDHDLWSSHPRLYRDLTERAVRIDPLFAYDVAAEGLAHFPAGARLDQLAKDERDLALRLNQLMGLALIQCGALMPAHAILTGLHQQGLRDGETLGLLGRTFKELALSAQDQDQRTGQMRKAHSAYLGAYKNARKEGRLDHASYNGINAAMTALLSADADLAQRLAREVEVICEEQLNAEDAHQDHYWPLATLGEAALIQRDEARSRKYYGLAARAARGQRRDRDLGASRRQAALVLDHTGDIDLRVEELIPAPSCVVFGSWRAEQEGEITQSDMSESALADEIARCLDGLGASVGYASAASVAELLFLEELNRQDAEINVVLPYPAEVFKESWIRRALGNQWAERFDRLVSDAARVLALCDFEPQGLVEAQYFADLHADGLAALRARSLSTVVERISLAGEIRPGPAASLPDLWHREGRKVHPIGNRSNATKTDVSQSATSGLEPESDLASARRIRAMLFADTSGYSDLPDHLLPDFMTHFLRPVAEVAQKYDASVLHRRTTGDGLFFVLADVRSACRFGLDLRDRFDALDWAAVGLARHLGLRLSIDCGPVHAQPDPVTGGVTYCGAYVNRAARIEPVTPPGNVYVSESFAAVATAENVGGIALEYVGNLTLPKAFGTTPAYHLRRA
ncbi:MAG: RyR domain-containing protein [Alphaproteobacteria bacterium]|nr:RyR domain-containing protein [Alphaproteobacteria bacterium]